MLNGTQADYYIPSQGSHMASMIVSILSPWGSRALAMELLQRTVVDEMKRSLGEVWVAAILTTGARNGLVSVEKPSWRRKPGEETSREHTRRSQCHYGSFGHWHRKRTFPGVVIVTWAARQRIRSNFMRGFDPQDHAGMSR